MERSFRNRDGCCNQWLWNQDWRQDQNFPCKHAEGIHREAAHHTSSRQGRKTSRRERQWNRQQINTSCGWSSGNRTKWIWPRRSIRWRWFIVTTRSKETAADVTLGKQLNDEQEIQLQELIKRREHTFTEMTGNANVIEYEVKLRSD